VEAGAARVVGTDASRIVAETFSLLDDPEACTAMAQPGNLCGDDHAAERIICSLLERSAKLETKLNRNIWLSAILIVSVLLRIGVAFYLGDEVDAPTLLTD